MEIREAPTKFSKIWNFLILCRVLPDMKMTDGVYCMDITKIDAQTGLAMTAFVFSMSFLVSVVLS